jgi:hypothetical protein
MNKTLFLGSRDPAVVKLTTALAAQGHWHGPATGIFDEEVENAVKYFQMTHQDRAGKMLSADGVVGPKTWWALENPEGDLQRSRILAILPDGLGPLRRRLLSVAVSEHAKNVREQPGGSNRGPEIDKYLPQHWLRMPGPPWCAFFYSWVNKAGLGYWPLGKREGSCAAARKLAAERDMWLPRQVAVDTQAIVPGDAFILGRGHIGFVLRVSDTQYNTIEGNCGNRVKLGLRELNSPDLSGFIISVPDEPSEGFERGVLQGANVAVDSVR